MATEDESPTLDLLDSFRQFFSLERDVLILSVAMLAFSLGFQMTSRYLPEYMRVLGAGAGIIGLYGSVGNLISAAYPYPGGTVSDRLGSRVSLTAFAIVTTIGFGTWWAAAALGSVSISGVTVPAWGWVFVGIFLAQTWKSFGLGATFAIVKQSTPPEHLAMGFASTEVFRRIGFLLGPLLAAIVLATAATFIGGFRSILLLAIAVAAVATVVQHVLYDASEDSIGRSFEGVNQILSDLRSLPATLKPLLVADTFIRFANGMVYVFSVPHKAG